MAGLLLLGDFLGDRDENVHSQQAHAVLIVAGQVLEQGYYFINDHLCLHFLDELGKIICRLSSHHRRFVMYKASEILAETLLQWRL